MWQRKMWIGFCSFFLFSFSSAYGQVSDKQERDLRSTAQELGDYRITDALNGFEYEDVDSVKTTCIAIFIDQISRKNERYDFDIVLLFEENSRKFFGIISVYDDQFFFFGADGKVAKLNVKK